ncbi:MAG: hypothetical protein ACRDHS_14935, partial [Actinomycetota bacterium]
YYAWRSRPPSARTIADAQLTLDSIKLLQESIAMGEISCADAVKLYEKMRRVSLLPEGTRQQLCS